MILSEDSKGPRGPQAMGRMRTLDKFPMKYSRSEIHSRLSAYRANQVQQQTDAQKATQASANLRNYGKQLFNDSLTKCGSSGSDSNSALNRNTSSSLPNILFTSRDKKSDPPSYAKCKHSGPSRQGSILYNRKPTLMNSIRLRANSEPPVVTPRARTANGQLEVTLKNSNVVYRVVGMRDSSHASCGSRGSIYSCPPVAFTDFVLVPADQDVIHEVPEHQPQIEDSRTVTIISEHSQEEEPKWEEPKEEEELKEEGLKEEEPMEEEPMEEEPIKEEHPVSAANHVLPAPGKPKGLTNGEIKESQKEGSEHSSISSKDSKSEWRRRSCWVDFATVTSSSKASEHSAPPPTPPPEPKNTKEVKFQKNAKKAPKTKEPEPAKEEPQNGEPQLEEPGKEQAQEEVKVLSLNELQEGQVHLPQYICPSSEEKSKQARIKDWLEKTSFAWANRNVPLL